MDHAELCTNIWLGNQGFSDIQYIHRTHEPPPDFLVNDRIAVEVRRLNWMTDDDNQELEIIEFHLVGNILEVLENAEAPPENCIVYVSCDYFSSTFPAKEGVRSELEQAANQHVATIKNVLQTREYVPPQLYELDCGLSIHFITTQEVQSGSFELMGVQAGIAECEWVVTDAIDNINRCIVERTNRIQDKKDLHDEWWLVLVEHNVYASVLQDPNELQAVKNGLVDTTPWSRIIILSCLEGMPNLDLI